MDSRLSVIVFPQKTVMKEIFYIFILLLLRAKIGLALFLIPFLFCQCSQRQHEKKYIIEGEENIQIINNRINVVVACGKDSVRLFLDAGCFVGCVLTDSLVSRLATDSLPSSGSQRTQKYIIPPFVFDTARVQYDYIVRNNYYGVSFFAPDYHRDQRTWEINFEKSFIHLHDSCPMDETDALVLPFHHVEGRNAIILKIPIMLVSGKDTLKIDNEYLFDLGGTVSPLLFFEPDETLQAFSEKSRHLDIETSVSGKLQKRGKWAIDRYFDVDGLFLPEGNILPCRDYIRISGMPRNVSVLAGLSPKVKGTIGTAFFIHYNVFLDLRNKNIVLFRHGKDYSSFKSKLNRLGFSVMPGEDGLHVESLHLNSPAAKAGLQIGDVLLSVNGNTHVTPQLYDSLQSTIEGTAIKLVVKRGGMEVPIDSKIYNPFE